MINVEFTTVIIHLAFFLVMVYLVLNPLLFQPILRVMEERDKKVAGNLEAAREAEAAGHEAKDRFDREINEAKKTAVVEKDQARKVAEEEEARVVKAARERAGDMVAEIREKISAEYDQAKKTLQDETEAIGKDIAAKILGREV